MLSDRERARILVEWNDTAAPFPSNHGVHHLIEDQVMRTPTSPAVLAGEASITYAELDARAERLAHHLRGVGVGPGVIVGLSLPRGIGMVVALLAVLKAGGSYLPLDPAYPPDRLNLMMEDAAAPVVVTQSSLLPRLPAHSANLVCIDREQEAVGQGSLEPHEAGFDAEQVAYVIYTSGSTGRPKGVQVPHRAMVNFLTTMADRPGIGPADVLVAVTTLSFDIAGLELLLPLTVGARVVVAPAEVAAAPAPLMELIERSGATVMQATPATWRMLVDAGWTGIHGLKVLCGGEALPVALAEALLERGVQLWNMYGPTETTVWSTILHVTNPRQAFTIGRPIANTTIYILDPMLEPVPVGTPGELYIGGAGVAKGYLRRPDLTAERFVTHPFDATPGARVYKTGDLARWAPDGTIEFLGRLDHQVKIRGFRIELGEIESALEALPGVRAAIVTAQPDPSGASRLVAYLVPEAPSPTVSELRHGLSQRLPPHMVPSSFVMLEELPLNPAGKVDRNALPVPVGSRPDMLSAFVAPRSLLERTLAELWADALGVDDVGIEDDFFELGGHSLLSVRLVSRIRDVIGAELSLAALYDAPTVAELAVVVAGCEGRGDQPQLVALDRSTFMR